MDLTKCDHTTSKGGQSKQSPGVRASAVPENVMDGGTFQSKLFLKAKWGSLSLTVPLWVRKELGQRLLQVLKLRRGVYIWMNIRAWEQRGPRVFDHLFWP